MRERGLKLAYAGRSQPQNKVAPVRERGLKYDSYGAPLAQTQGRSREGAWIEIMYLDPLASTEVSLP